MRFLSRLLPYWRWIAGVIGVAALVGSVVYAWQVSIDREIAQRAYEQTRQQLEAVTKELEQEQARREQESRRVDEAEKEAGEIDDAGDIAPKSTRHLLNRLYD